jgi:hypothetical protein
MCGFVANCFDFDKLTAKEKRELKKNLEARKKELERRVKEVTSAIDALKKGGYSAR